MELLTSLEIILTSLLCVGLFLWDINDSRRK